METLGKQLTGLTTKVTGTKEQQRRIDELAAEQTRLELEAAADKYLEDHGGEIIERLGALASSFARNGQNAARVTIMEQTGNYQGLALVQTMLFVGDHFAKEEFKAELIIRDDVFGREALESPDATCVETDLRITWGKDIQPGFSVRTETFSPYSIPFD